MVNIEELLGDYICKANNKIAELSSQATDLLEKTGCKCDITEYAYMILDINSTLFLFNKSFVSIETTFGYPNYLNAIFPEDPKDNVRSIIDKYVIRYDMNDSSLLVYPGHSSTITVNPCCDCEGGSLIPDGGGPDQYLTRDSNGNLVWDRIESYIDSVKYIYNDAEPQEFELPEGATATGVYVRGVRVPDNPYWSQTDEVVTIGSGWVIGDGSEVEIEYKYGSILDVSFQVLGERVFREEFTLVLGGDTINTVNNIQSVWLVTLNGHEIDSQDYTFTQGTNILTLDDDLEGTNQVNIIYEII